MAFQDMRGKLRGIVPKLPYEATASLINDAWRDVRKANLWSFQCFESGWIAPPLINTGTCTVVQGLNTVIFDATAKAAIASSFSTYPYSLITQRQFRIFAGGIYNIWQYNPSTGVATLDRVYGEPSGSGSSFFIYQLYYAAPMQDFRAWISIRNMITFMYLDSTKTREWLNHQDPQRSLYFLPSHVVPYQFDMNPASTTFQWPMFEMWAGPQQNWNFQLYGLRKGTDLVQPTDTLPAPIGEDLVVELGKYKAYEWAEANKGKYVELQKSDYRFLMGASMKEYLRLRKEYVRDDREYMDNFFSVRDPRLYPRFWSYYNSIGGVANPGMG